MRSKRKSSVGRAGWRGDRLVLLLLVAALAGGCSRPESDLMTTGKTVRQERIEAAQGLGGYRAVEMPEAARRNLVEADPGAAGAAAYRRSISGS